jgi:3-phosphoshikimate 1-carboxyvinyltransferase
VSPAGGALEVRPLTAPIDAEVSVPGSKSLTNRALVAAALAEGTSVVEGGLVADDTEAMAGCLRRLGAVVDRDADTWTVTGRARPAPGPAWLDARQSGTTARFLAPVLALGDGRYHLDGAASLRARPLAPTIDALRRLGVEVVEEGGPGRLPVTVVASGLPGGVAGVRGDGSSQFVSGLLLAAPRAASPLTVEVEGEPVARPYLDLTVAVMRAFGAEVAQHGHERFEVEATGYRPARYRVEPDASSAAYLLAAAALCGGRVTVRDLGRDSRQGDAAVVDVLARMGAEVSRAGDVTTVVGTGRLRAVDVDLGDLPDMALLVAVLAACADGPSVVRGVAVIRGHETDRIAALASELGRCGVRVDVTADGWVVHPSPARPAVVETYDDHRMAMSFAVLGLRVPGIAVADPGCVAKTFPGFWSALESLRPG